MASQSLTGTMAGPGTPGSPYVFLLHAIGRAIHGRRGVWGYVNGGMGAVTQALAAAARDMGVEIRTSTPVGEVLVEGGVATGVLLENGETLRARVVLSNADPKRTFLKLTPTRRAACRVPPADRAELPHRRLRLQAQPGAARAAALQRRPG